MRTELPDGVEIRRSARARRVALRLDTKERVMRLVVPKRFSLKKAARFAYDNEEWIRSKLGALQPPVPFENGAEIPVLGQLRIIKLRYDPTLKRTSINLTEKEILVSTNQEDFAPRLTRFLRQKAKTVMTALAREKAAQAGRPLNKLSVRDTKTRWGSCTEDGNISLSWRLIFAPYEAMDYVIAHEVAHLVHLDHSKAFWALCRELSDDFLEGQYWMKNHGHELMAYG